MCYDYSDSSLLNVCHLPDAGFLPVGHFGLWHFAPFWPRGRVYPLRHLWGRQGAGQLPNGGQQVLSPRPGLHDPLQVIRSVGPVPSDFQVDKGITQLPFLNLHTFLYFHYTALALELRPLTGNERNQALISIFWVLVSLIVSILKYSQFCINWTE